MNLTADSTHAFSIEFDAVGVVNDAVKDRVGVSWVRDKFVPAIDRELRSDDG